MTENNDYAQDTIDANRVYASKLRARIIAARNLLLRHEHMGPVTRFERDALTILSRALEIKP